MKSLNKYIKESLLDDEDELEKNTDNSLIINGLVNIKNQKSFEDCYNFFSNDIINNEQEIKMVYDRKVVGETFEKNKIYIIMDSVLKDIVLFKSSKKKQHKSFCMFGTSNRHHWYACYQPLSIFKVQQYAHYNRTDIAYELPERYYDLWNKLQEQLIPSNRDYDINKKRNRLNGSFFIMRTSFTRIYIWFRLWSNMFFYISGMHRIYPRFTKHTSDGW